MAKAQMIKWADKEKKPPFARKIDENTLEIKIKKKRFLITGTDFAILGVDAEDNAEQSLIVEDGVLDESELTIEEVEVKDDDTEEPELDENGKPVNKPGGDADDPDNGNPDPDDPDAAGNGKPGEGDGKRQPRPDGKERKFSKRVDFTKKLNDAKGGNPDGKED